VGCENLQRIDGIGIFSTSLYPETLVMFALSFSGCRANVAQAPRWGSGSKIVSEFLIKVFDYLGLLRKFSPASIPGVRARLMFLLPWKPFFAFLSARSSSLEDELLLLLLSPFLPFVLEVTMGSKGGKAEEKDAFSLLESVFL